MAKKDYHHWCAQVRARLRGTAAADLMTLAEREFLRHDVVAKACKRPASKNHVRRSFQDCVGGMRQIGANQYDLYDDFTPHVLNLSDPVAIFLFPTVQEGCERYGRARVPQAPSVGVPSPLPRTPQEWKWGPQHVLLTPATKKVRYVGSALRLRGPGAYHVPEIDLTVLTGLDDPAFRRYVATLRGKADLVSKVRAAGYKGSVVMVPDPAGEVQVPARAAPGQ